MDRSSTVPSPDRWFDAARITCATPSSALSEGAVRDHLSSSSSPRPYEVDELPRTAYENAAIDLCVRGLHELQRAVGVDETPIPASRIHVLDRAMFAQRLPDPTAAGLTSLGHVYLVRNADDPLTFIRALTHEIAHAASFCGIAVTVDATDADAPLIEVRQDRSGHAIWPDPCGDARFEGLNEAITEMVAYGIRHAFTDREDLLDARQSTLLTASSAYAEHVRLVEAIGARVSSVEPDWRIMLFRDYFTGTQDLVWTANRIVPFVARTLYRTDRSPVAALHAAWELDLIADTASPRPPTAASSR